MMVLARNWWALALRGLLAVLFGLAAFIWPGLTVTVLVLLFAAYVLLDGVFAMIAAIRAAERRLRWWPLLLEGALGILVGVVTFVTPAITALVLLSLIAAWLVVTGALEIIAAVRLRREIEGEWLLALSGIASIACGVLLVIFPGAGTLAVVWLVGAYALVFGLLLILLAVRLRGWQQYVGA